MEAVTCSIGSSPAEIASTCRNQRRRLAPPSLDQAHFIDTESVSSASSSAHRRTHLADLPQDLGVLVCQCLGAADVVKFLLAGRRMRDVAGSEEVWRFFCCERWGQSANFKEYKRAKDLFLDSNGWFPQRYGRRESPHFEVRNASLHESSCLTMDIRMTSKEIVTVSEAPRDRNDILQQACVHVIDPETMKTRQRFEVSTSTINCCDVGSGVICLGSDDSKVRLYRQVGYSSADGLANGAGSYDFAAAFDCTSEVNDLRFAREEYVIAVRTHLYRHPAGLDLIPVERPDARFSFPGGSPQTRGKYIHALDGFEDGCSINGIACSGEHPVTSAFSAMLFDFRHPNPCVADLPVTSSLQGYALGTMLWPLRAGQSPKVYANLLHESSDGRNGGTIAMVDFRYPAKEVVDVFHLPDPVDDFRCFGGSIYAACTEVIECTQRLRLHRCTPGRAESECLCTIVEEYDAGGRSAKEDLKVFSISSHGFVVSHGEQLTYGRVVEPIDGARKRRQWEEAVSLPTCRGSTRRRSGVLVGEELRTWETVCSV
mmetsp:Transcript_46082/g.72821  ORF Transcript_46082/g.72821 Transcript_46082/m.72821 type:complete len:542 (-) Transcript_46082:195-1820(-)